MKALVIFLIVLHSNPLLYAQARPQQVENLRIWHSPNRTRVVFDVTADLSHQMFILQDPLRLVVDIMDADLSIKLPTLDSNNQHISAIRSGRPNDHELRFVFELKKKLLANDFVLSPNELYGHRLVVDLIEDMPTPPTTIIEQTPERIESGQINAAAVTLVESKQKESVRPILIAIDAGHGGEDPGAVGYRGSREKKITLAIANKLKKIIDRDPRMRSFMVREGDYYIKLHKRRQMARVAMADLFISIHADAFRKRSARGFSVFALSQRGATSAMASALAVKENASDLIGGVSLADKDDLLAKVLVDLSMTNTISESVNLGGRVLKKLSKLGKLHSNRVEQAGFAVLKSADIPSILIETGFITNPDEERKLKSKAYQEQLANAIYAAINEYFRQTPYRSSAHYATPSVNNTTPPSTYTSLVKPNFHKVVQGDSLSKIAQRYGTTVGQIKRLNKLRGNIAVLGQRLKLPGHNKPSPDTRKQVAQVSSQPILHIVRRGESLSKISHRFNVTIKSLKTANQLSGNTVYVGQKLRIPGRGQSHKFRLNQKPRTHIVKRGDTLSEIAEFYNSSMPKIVQANSLSSHAVFLGQKLVIPN